MKVITQTLKRSRRLIMAFGLAILFFAVLLTGTQLDSVLTENGHHALFVIAGLLIGYGFASIPND